MSLTLLFGHGLVLELFEVSLAETILLSFFPKALILVFFEYLSDGIINCWRAYPNKLFWCFRLMLVSPQHRSSGTYSAHFGLEIVWHVILCLIKFR